MRKDGATVKERPILFSGPMVRALLDGSKTQTRRIVKHGHSLMQPLRIGPHPYSTGEYLIERWEKADREFQNFNRTDCVKCPFGVVGDRLWVRESFRTDIRDPLGCVVYEATPEIGKYKHTGEIVRSKFIDGTLPTREESERAMLPKFWKKKPSIHMPRWASRLTLEITGVRVERLNEISQPDIAAEGIDCHPTGNHRTQEHYRSQFQFLWESIYGVGSWALNPWVWVIEFRRVGA
jgi:hypothetical protein